MNDLTPQAGATLALPAPADEAHRFEVRAQIVTCLIVLECFGKLTPEEIADALMLGQIKHCEVRL